MTLSSAGLPIAAVQADIAFDPGTAVDVTAQGHPHCAVNPAINKNATSFIFVPPACSPGIDCHGIRADVVAIDNLDPIPDGTRLFTCTVAIARTATIGSNPLVCSAPEASNTSGDGVPVACSDGSIVVLQPCVGDCNGDHQVTINELILGVSIALGSAPLGQCPALDANLDHVLTINELVQGVGNALSGCPAA